MYVDVISFLKVFAVDDESFSLDLDLSVRW